MAFISLPDFRVSNSIIVKYSVQLPSSILASNYVT